MKNFTNRLKKTIILTSYIDFEISFCDEITEDDYVIAIDGGYDIVEHLDDVLAEFDRIIGLERLKAIHLNDSKNPMGSHKDRHACLDEGEIGMAALSRIINHPKLKHLPFLLETPNELDGYAREIAWLRELREGE